MGGAADSWPLARPAPPAPLAPPAQSSALLTESILSQQLSSPKASPAGTTAPAKPKQTRTRQKNRWKLKFHHQALPPEYLDHYEASLNKTNPPAQTPPPPRKQVKKALEPQVIIKTEPELELNNNFTNETLQAWAERLSSLQKDQKFLPEMIPLLNAQLFFNADPNMGKTVKSPAEGEKKKKQHHNTAPSRVMTYNDLPYMGEMTLNNSKPRRGRKPKKADICHLIYENYGTIVPGQPPRLPDDNKASQIKLGSPSAIMEQLEINKSPVIPVQKTDLQNRIITSLLERKLSQENKRRKENKLKKTKCLSEAAPVCEYRTLHSDDEPLNLCMRDLFDLKLEIQKKFGNIYEPITVIKEEPDNDIISDVNRLENGTQTPNAISVIQKNTNHISPVGTGPPSGLSFAGSAVDDVTEYQNKMDIENQIPGGLVYWPSTGLYIHPLALQSHLLYYQNLADNNSTNSTPSPDVMSERNIPSTPNSTTSDSTSTDVSTPPALENNNKLVLKQITDLLEPNALCKQLPMKKPQNEKPASISESPKLKRNTPIAPGSQGPLKRKRSAIFIPPMPAKNNATTPTTEVSICKFKFTGGSKPSLEEKKMLSVDSGGNFRYYNGTGNKASRGYEYFPRETLPQPPSGDAESNDQVYNAALTHSFNNSLKSAILGASTYETKSVQQAPTTSSMTSAPTTSESIKKKRKSRKSLQREKLEQTFKEKGFLIQTQQLESAEGATYCKFRQLRKFTRYLFRSWKDYLPGNLEPERGTMPPQPIMIAEQSCDDDWS